MRRAYPSDAALRYVASTMPRRHATRWNRLRYGLYAPVYDRVARFGAQRRRAVELLDPRPGERLLIVGAGTGADLPYLPPDVEVVALDITPAMVRRAAARAKALDREIELHVMDAQALDLASGSFDAAVLHLIVAVVPDPDAMLDEVHRVVRPGGRIVVFDKFHHDDAPISWLRRVVNVVTEAAFSSIDRRLRPLLERAGFTIVQREPSLFGGLFQIATAERKGRPDPPSATRPEPRPPTD